DPPSIAPTCTARPRRTRATRVGSRGSAPARASGRPRGARMKLLVTGGAGFIGSNFIRHLLREHPDDSVVNLDKLTSAGNPANLADVAGDPRYAFVQGDICDAKLVRDVARGVDAIVNLAAESHVHRSLVEPDG